MRTDVKLGVAISMVVVFVAGGYFILRGGDAKPINLAEDARNAAAAPKETAKPATAQPALDSNTSRRNTPNVAAAPNRNNRQPADRTVTPQAQPNVAANPPSSVEFAHNTRDPAENASVPAAPPAGTNPMASSGTQPASTPTEGPNLADRSAQPASSTPPQNVNAPTQAPSSAMEALAAMRKSAPPAEAKPNANPPKAAVDIHRAQPGDTLASLAQTYYGNAKYASVLRQANPDVTDPSSLRVGTAIRIPPLPADAGALALTKTPASGVHTPASNAGTSMAGGRTYVVKPGDSFYRIAEQQLGRASRWKELLALNKSLVDGDPTRLRVGQKVVLPES